MAHRASTKAHRSQCEYVRVACPNAREGCEKKILRKDLDEHMDACAFVPCPVEGCTTVGTHEMLERHREGCQAQVAATVKLRQQLVILEFELAMKDNEMLEFEADIRALIKPREKKRAGGRKRRSGTDEIIDESQAEASGLKRRKG